MELLIVACLATVVAGNPQFGMAGGHHSPSGIGTFADPTHNSHSVPQSTKAATPSANLAGRAQGPAPKTYVNPYGPKAYGMGLNNPFALPPDHFTMQRALSLANQHDGLLVRVDADGDVTLTDRFGKNVEAIYDSFGRDLTKLYNL